MNSSNARSSAKARAGPRGPDFMGIGAQRTGTSWMYACLYEHPQICMPQKEIRFFSSDPIWSRGFEWYEGIFAECPSTAVAGEFSTSYLTNTEAPARVRNRYPEARLIVSLRHPVDRAYSNYLNSIVAGAVSPATGFLDAIQTHPHYVEAGRYSRYLRNWLGRFPRDQLLVSIFEDARRDPLAAIQEIYRFLDVDPAFRPTMLHRRVGIGRVPRSQSAERSLLGVSAVFKRRRSLRPLWWMAKRMGVGDQLRALNTHRSGVPGGLASQERRVLMRELEPEIRALEELLQIELPAWRP